MSQTYLGEVQNGVVVFEAGPPPEGTKVRVEPVAGEGRPDGDVVADPLAATRAWLLAVAAEAEANAPPLPSDLAENHDHYAHGKPLPS